MEDKILEGLAYALPAAVTGFVTYFMFSKFIERDDSEKKFDALVQKKRESLPLKLQAYERLLLFSERMNPSNLLLRVQPNGNDAQQYAQLLNATIEQEFEHNLVQQIYVADDAWNAVIKAKAAIMKKFTKAAEVAKDAKTFRENLLIDASQTENPSDVAVTFIKREVKKIL